MSTLCHQEIPINERKNYEQLKQCGEITASADGSFVGLNCIFCKDIFLKLETFVPHILELHSAEIIGLYATKCTKETVLQDVAQLDGFVEIKVETDVKVDNTIITNYAEGAIKDPLEVQPHVKHEGIDVMKGKHDSLEVVPVNPKETSDIMEVEASKSDTDKDSTIDGKDECNELSTCGETPTVIIRSEKLSELAAIYKLYPCLWDLDHEENRDKTRKNEAEKQMLQHVSQELNTQLTLIELKSRLSALRRIYAKEKRRRLQAEESKKLFKPTHLLYTNLEFLDHSVGPFKCKECSKIIPSHDKFRIHQAAHAGVMPFVCKICGKGMNYLGNLQLHMRRHTGEAQFLCSYCGKGLPSSFELNLHMNTHSDACNYVCDICGKAFSKPKFLDRHKLTHDPKNKAYKCTVCSKAFFQHYKYQEHMNSHLNIRNCVCQICGKGFFSKKTLYQHRATHAAKKAYTCKICRKDYARSESYYNHMKVQHSMEKKDIAKI